MIVSTVTRSFSSFSIVFLQEFNVNGYYYKIGQSLSRDVMAISAPEKYHTIQGEYVFENSHEPEDHLLPLNWLILS